MHMQPAHDMHCKPFVEVERGLEMNMHKVNNSKSFKLWYTVIWQHGQLSYCVNAKTCRHPRYAQALAQS